MKYTIENDTDFVKALTMDKYDRELGARVREHLTKKGLETNIASAYSPEDAFSFLEDAVRQALLHLGLDPDDPSTMETPRRYATMVVGELTKGLNYDFFPKCTTTPNGFMESYWRTSGSGDCEVEEPGPRDGVWESERRKGAYDQMVLSRSIETISLCEHHLQTIYGHTHIGYIPSTKVLGLSKFARVTDFFARRPQIQERLTEQIYEALSFVLETKDIAVVVDAEHFCMKARGAMQAKATTQTNKMGGRFLTVPALREEFFDAIKH